MKALFEVSRGWYRANLIMVIRIFPVETCGGERYMSSYLFPHVEIKSWAAGK